MQTVDTVRISVTGERNISESANASETVSGGQTFAVAVSDTANISERILSAFGISGAVTETANVSDEYVGIRNTFGTIDETVTAAEFANAQAIFQTLITELLTAQDEITVATENERRIAESVTITDSWFAQYLWNLINDAQIADWRPINDDVSGGWQIINTTENASWQVINTIM